MTRYWSTRGVGFWRVLAYFPRSPMLQAVCQVYQSPRQLQYLDRKTSITSWRAIPVRNSA
ncbi:hypothetical protein BGY98DRAFT_969770 [Russula aff. rugulosa BPL654]|nr:hypothetical protein BGY98DRAFT_969770 [Russula aff. rugulosa BPL654]